MNLCKLCCVFYVLSSLFNVNSFYVMYGNGNGNKLGATLYMKQSKKTYKLYTPKNINQKKLVNYLDDKTSKIVISLGPAGTGKTLFSCQKAISDLKKEEINKIIITRPVVTVEEEIGFLPGNIIKKMDPWTKPIFDIFLEYYSKTELDFMLSTGKIEICPLAFMRGRTFKDSFILADEMQNSSPSQMKMLTTRVGDNSKLVITGDLNQSDILKENGLYDLVSKVERYNNTEMIKIVRFGNSDVERSEIVKKIIEIYSYVKPVNTTDKVTNDTITKNENITTNSDAQPKMINKISNNPVNNNDAALIPKHHVTHNYDIFFESRDF